MVGADGIHSQVRELVFGPEVQPRYTGQVSGATTSRASRASTASGVYMGPAGNAGLVPLGPDLMYLLQIEKPPGARRSGSRRKVSPRPSASASRRLAA